MKTSSTISLLSALAGLVSGHGHRHGGFSDREYKTTPLKLSVQSTGNHHVQVQLANTGSKDLRVMHLESFLDGMDTQSVTMKKNKAEVPFLGFMANVATETLPSSAFTLIKAGHSVNQTIDLSRVHDLAEGGDFEIHLDGGLRVAESMTSNKLARHPMAYRTDKPLTVTIDGLQAGAARRSMLKAKLAKRATLQGDCQGDTANLVNQAFDACANFANSAADTALSGDPAIFQRWFKTDDPAARQTVHDRLKAVSAECGAKGAGVIPFHCSDLNGGCAQQGVLAYTYPDTGDMTMCPYAFQIEPVTKVGCGAYELYGTILHEMTHASPVFSDWAQDNGYGFNNDLLNLDANAALHNADSHTWFTQDAIEGCANPI